MSWACGRVEAGTGRRRPWWLSIFTGKEALAMEFIREHSRKVADVMTREVITAAPDTPLWKTANLLEKNAIKRVPIVEDHKVVGIVSRANLLQALVSLSKRAEVAHEIAFADDTDELAVRANDRDAADPRGQQNMRDLLNAGIGTDRDHVPHHYVSGFHGTSPFAGPASIAPQTNSLI